MLRDGCYALAATQSMNQETLNVSFNGNDVATI